MYGLHLFELNVFFGVASRCSLSENVSVIGACAGWLIIKPPVLIVPDALVQRYHGSRVMMVRGIHTPFHVGKKILHHLIYFLRPLVI